MQAREQEIRRYEGQCSCDEMHTNRGPERHESKRKAGHKEGHDAVADVGVGVCVCERVQWKSWRTSLVGGVSVECLGSTMRLRR